MSEVNDRLVSTSSYQLKMTDNRLSNAINSVLIELQDIGSRPVIWCSVGFQLSRKKVDTGESFSNHSQPFAFLSWLAEDVLEQEIGLVDEGLEDRDFDCQ